MSKQTLSVVSNEVESPLARARNILAKRQKERTDADAALQEAIAQQARVERLIPNVQAITDRVQELEAEHAALIEEWAKKGDGAPKLPHAAEIDRLKKQLRDAENAAVVAKPALVRLTNQITNCQQACGRAVEGVADAANDVLVEQARELATMLEPMEQRAALMRAHLVALQRHFELEGQRGRPVGNLSSVIARMIPRGPYEMAPNSVNQIVNKWNLFAQHLFGDNNAELELSQ